MYSLYCMQINLYWPGITFALWPQWPVAWQCLLYDLTMHEPYMCRFQPLPSLPVFSTSITFCWSTACNQYRYFLIFTTNSSSMNASPYPAILRTSWWISSHHFAVCFEQPIDPVSRQNSIQRLPSITNKTNFMYTDVWKLVLASTISLFSYRENPT